MTIHYVTSITQDYLKVRRYAKRLAAPTGALIMEMPARLPFAKRGEWAQTIWEFHEKSNRLRTIVAVSMEEKPLLHLFRCVVEAALPDDPVEELKVHFLHAGARGVQIVRVSNGGYLTERVVDGFFCEKDL